MKCCGLRWRYLLNAALLVVIIILAVDTMKEEPPTEEQRQLVEEARINNDHKRKVIVPTYDPAQEQVDRLKVIDEVCRLQNNSAWDGNVTQSYIKLSKDHVFKDHIIVNDDLKVLYCFVPKVSCTNWKRLMMVMSGNSKFKDPMQIPRALVRAFKGLTLLKNLSGEEVVKRLEEYTKFIFVREPLERVVSAYIDKLTKNTMSASVFKKIIGKKIQQSYRDEGDSTSDTGSGTTFEELVQYIIDSGWKQVNGRTDHWENAWRLCKPCSARYDFIGKFEHIGEDSALLLSRIGAPAGISYPPIIEPNTNEVFENYMDQISVEMKEKLQEAFINDYQLFGYKKRTFS